MYERITGENAYERPMRIYPALHYTMGGLWVDYTLMSNVDGLFVLGEANFSDHGANRLGASALMQGLADGYFVIPYTLGNYFGRRPRRKVVPTDHAEFKRAARPRSATGPASCCRSGARRRPSSSTATWASVMWDNVGMARTAAGARRRRSARSASCGRSSGRA